MSVELTLEIDSAELTTRLTGIVQQIEGPVLEVSGRSMLNYFKDYHTDFAPRWTGAHHLAGGPSGRFAADVVLPWPTPLKTRESGGNVTNIHPYLSHKIHPGPLYPDPGKK